MNDVERAVYQWVITQDPDEFAGWAEAGVDLEPRLRRQFGVRLRGAAAARRLGLLRDSHLTEVRAVDADRLVRALLAESPEHGVVCWRHKQWFRAQVVNLRERFLALVGAPA